ncbi:MAG: cytochrome P450 [Pseudomonadota bacterium]
MQSTIQAIPVASDKLRTRPNQHLKHLPGPKGHWLFGNAKELMPNLGPFIRQAQTEHGDCFTIGLFRNQRALVMVGPEANQRVLLDRNDDFSTRWGWQILHVFFGRNLLVRDFEDHRQHRRLINDLFKPAALAGYLDQMNLLIAESMDAYQGDVDVYRQTKQMALDIAVEVFAGIEPGPESISYNRDLNEILSNAMAHRINLPGTRYRRGLKAKARLTERLLRALQNRRGQNACDLFSHLANVTDESGAMLSDQDVIDHMLGMLFAAHDTTASSLAMIFWLLAEHPEWQTALRDECEALYRTSRSLGLRYADLDQLPKVEWVFKEALRLYSPIQIIPRRTVRDIEYMGYRIPKNTWVMLIPQATHLDARYFEAPDLFRPSRFDPNNEGFREVEPFAFIPFGRGSHMCLGMRFAYMEVKAVLYQILLQRRLSTSDGQNLDLEYLPLVRPAGQMQVRFEKRSPQQS